MKQINTILEIHTELGVPVSDLIRRRVDPCIRAQIGIRVQNHVQTRGWNRGPVMDEIRSRSKK